MSMDANQKHDDLTEYLAQRDIPCPSCKYNLRGLKETRCPECNQLLVLGVQLAEPRIGPFIAVCIGLGTGIGFNLFIFSWWLYSFLMLGQIIGSMEVVSLPISVGVLGALLWFTIRQRSRFRRVGIQWQWACGVLAAGLSISSAVCFFNLMR